MSTEAAVPGEIDLETLEVTPPAVEPEPEPVATVEPPAIEPEPEPAKGAKPGMLEELIEHRTIRKRLEQERAGLAPVIERLTPELRQAIAEGRVMVKPVPVTSDERRAALTKRAERLRLVDAEGKPDLDAAERVEAEIRDVAREENAPLREARTQDLANNNYAIAMTAVAERGYSADVQAVFKEVFSNTPAGILADPELAKGTWEVALGKAVARGLQIGPSAQPAVVREKGPVAVVTEPTGRRGPSAGLTLSPQLAKVYKDNGLDPNKSFSATKKDADLSQGVTLE